jgi:hypothetical protein
VDRNQVGRLIAENNDKYDRGQMSSSEWSKRDLELQDVLANIRLKEDQCEKEGKPGCWCFCRSQSSLGYPGGGWLLAARRAVLKSLSLFLRGLPGGGAVLSFNEEGELVVPYPEWSAAWVVCVVVSTVYYLPMVVFPNVTTNWMAYPTCEIPSFCLRWDYMLGRYLIRPWGKLLMRLMCLWALKVAGTARLTQEEVEAVERTILLRCLEKGGAASQDLQTWSKLPLLELLEVAQAQGTGLVQLGTV